ncbi:MAG: hypothetical protein ABEK50_15650, partial [bacterium]
MGKNAAGWERLAGGKPGVYYRTNRLFFRVDQPGTLQLIYGNKNASAPEYDIRLARTDILSSRAQQVTHREPSRRDQSPWWSLSVKGTYKRILIWAAMILTVTGLLYSIARLLPDVEEDQDS